ncbi:MAG: hypothetical protein KIT48_01080 [Pseudolabrys sp.]|nr:hypothetical protein [Pseudolabrys sp.]
MSTRTQVLAMKVKLCASCPYTPSDIGPHYSASADEYCCLACPSLIPTAELRPRRRRRRRTFVAVPQRSASVEKTPLAAAEAGSGI